MGDHISVGHWTDILSQGNNILFMSNIKNFSDKLSNTFLITRVKTLYLAVSFNEKAVVCEFGIPSRV